ncbi:hypothetical protein RYX45_14235 [Alkalihalophilus pseudofirmus]|uniref:Lipoprotein n=1 Tax=Alkalihalophilus pseudofirmus TaxID=79885 RepID=A0AAJ2NPS3_ALKPS|nr:hypothetical protein [Alkalihalophilus pseudofirmus]MDV2886345.1 hypothetical protein [Alkalihalophilus pseudofirmus]
MIRKLFVLWLCITVTLVGLAACSVESTSELVEALKEAELHKEVQSNEKAAELNDFEVMEKEEVELTVLFDSLNLKRESDLQEMDGVMWNQISSSQQVEYVNALFQFYGVILEDEGEAVYYINQLFAEHGEQESLYGLFDFFHFIDLNY